MNALLVIVALLGAEPDRQTMLDQTLDLIYTVEGSEAHQQAETQFRELSDKELARVYADYKIIRQEIRDLYAKRYTLTQRSVPPPTSRPIYTPEETRIPPVKRASYVGPFGHTVYVDPIVTEPGLCDGTSPRSIDWYRVENDPNYSHPALSGYVKGQGYQPKCENGTCPKR